MSAKLPKRIVMPGFIKPQLATLKSKAPNGEQWLHEIKYDGYRIQVHANQGRKKVYTRNGLDWTKRFSSIAAALDVPGEAIIDGEVVVVHEGRTNFSELQAELAAGRQDRLSSTPSTCSGATATSPRCLKLNARRRCWNCLVRTESNCRSYTPST
jgi:ATP-dependent DNA ligase